MKTVNLNAAKTQLSRLVDDAAAGEEVIIAKHGKPLARLMPLGPVKAERQLGLLAGRGSIPDDFDDPLPDHILKLFLGQE